MSTRTLLDKVWANHTVRPLPFGQTQLLVGTHLIHEVTSPQAFPMINKRGLKVRFPHRTFATVDHIVPTTANRQRPLANFMAELMLKHLEINTSEHNIRLFNLGDKRQGIVHVIGPELGITQPGMTIACGDSHTSTHGAFGSIAFGVGTTEISCILGSGCVILQKPKVRRIEVSGSLSRGVTAKDVILTIINKLGVDGGNGFAYEYAGEVLDLMSMDERMTVCNMSIEGNARFGYVNPDETTIEYLRKRMYVPQDAKKFDELSTWWLEQASDPDAEYDEIVHFDGNRMAPRFTWGIDPSQSIAVDDVIPENAPIAALNYMKLTAGAPIKGTPIDVAFLGSCTNGRASDLISAASLIREYRLKVAPGVKALVVPGSDDVSRTLKNRGADVIFRNAGWEFREAGCSMCLAMNDDKLVGDQVCVSTSNRNYKGRQGSKTGRTILASPESVVYSASKGCIADPREME